MQQFWWLLTMSAVGWYLTVTVYIAFQGALDIQQMLKRLKAQQQAPTENEPQAEHRR